MKWNRKKVLKGVKEVGILLAGNLLLAFLINTFVIPSNIIVGGATGIGIVLSKFLPLDTATIVLIFNVLVLALGAVVLGKKFFVSTVASSLLYPIFLGIMQRIPALSLTTENPLLFVLMGGGLLGVALGMIMRIGTSTGGADALSQMLHKWTHMPVSVCLWMIDGAIMLSQAMLATTDQIIYGIIFLMVESLVLDKVMLLGQSQIQILAISDKYEEIRRSLLNELSVGVTMLQVETGCLGKQQQSILCVIPPRKLHEATQMILAIDPDVFMTVTKIKEVRGQGFTLERSKAHDPQKKMETDKE
ncbi:MAG: YitT family protein [Oscillospiraceae bacterium]|nr:YitT family protein [Oscillospiraceae bacterium]